MSTYQEYLDQANADLASGVRKQFPLPESIWVSMQKPRGLCPDCGKPITLQRSGWWTHDGLPGDCWRQSMDGPNDENADTDTVSCAIPMKRGKQHRIDVSECEGSVTAACGRRLCVRSDAWQGEPPYTIRDLSHAAFLDDLDTCDSCRAIVLAGR